MLQKPVLVSLMTLTVFIGTPALASMDSAVPPGSQQGAMPQGPQGPQGQPMPPQGPGGQQEGVMPQGPGQHGMMPPQAPGGRQQMLPRGGNGMQGPTMPPQGQGMAPLPRQGQQNIVPAPQSPNAPMPGVSEQ